MRHPVQRVGAFDLGSVRDDDARLERNRNEPACAAGLAHQALRAIGVRHDLDALEGAEGEVREQVARRERRDQHFLGIDERGAVRFLRDELGVALTGTKVLMVSALDRFGMAQAFVDAGADVLFGDFIFALDLDKPVRGLAEFEALAERYLPDACKLPFQFFYPTGKKQDRPPQPKYPEYYAEAAIIAGDFHFMRQFMPERLEGKLVLTNTLTARDIDELRVRGVARVVSTTPAFEGRSFGTNVIEAALIALLGKRWSEVTPDDYAGMLERLQLRPRIVDLAMTAAG